MRNFIGTEMGLGFVGIQREKIYTKTKECLNDPLLGNCY